MKNPKESNEKINLLASKFKRTRDDKDFLALWEEYRPRIFRIISNVSTTFWYEARKDIVVEAKLGLYLAAINYNEVGNFSSYANKQIWGKCKHFMRDDIFRILTIGRYMKGPRMVFLSMLDDDEHPSYEMAHHKYPCVLENICSALFQ